MQALEEDADEVPYLLIYLKVLNGPSLEPDRAPANCCFVDTKCVTAVECLENVTPTAASKYSP
jgi:hypothetical protein